MVVLLESTTWAHTSLRMPMSRFMISWLARLGWKNPSGSSWVLGWNNSSANFPLHGVTQRTENSFTSDSGRIQVILKSQLNTKHRRRIIDGIAHGCSIRIIAQSARVGACIHIAQSARVSQGQDFVSHSDMWMSYSPTRSPTYGCRTSRTVDARGKIHRTRSSRSILAES